MFRKNKKDIGNSAAQSDENILKGMDKPEVAEQKEKTDQMISAGGDPDPEIMFYAKKSIMMPYFSIMLTGVDQIIFQFDSKYIHATDDKNSMGLQYMRGEELQVIAEYQKNMHQLLLGSTLEKLFQQDSIYQGGIYTLIFNPDPRLRSHERDEQLDHIGKQHNEFVQKELNPALAEFKLDAVVETLVLIAKLKALNQESVKRGYVAALSEVLDTSLKINVQFDHGKPHVVIDENDVLLGRNDNAARLINERVVQRLSGAQFKLPRLLQAQEEKQQEQVEPYKGELPAPIHGKSIR